MAGQQLAPANGRLPTPGRRRDRRARSAAQQVGIAQGHSQTSESGAPDGGTTGMQLQRAAERHAHAQGPCKEQCAHAQGAQGAHRTRAWAVHPDLDSVLAGGNRSGRQVLMCFQLKIVPMRMKIFSCLGFSFYTIHETPFLDWNNERLICCWLHNSKHQRSGCEFRQIQTRKSMVVVDWRVDQRFLI